MKPLDYIIIALVAVCFLLALKHSKKHTGCSGHCEGCHLCDKHK